MLISQSVKVLGNRLFNVYLAGTEEKVLLECAVSGLIPLLEKQVHEAGGAAGLKRLVVMHAHFDHVCGLPGLRGLFPTARSAGSAKAADILGREKVVANFFREDAAMTVTLARWEEKSGLPPTPGFTPPRTLPLDEIIPDGAVWHLSPGFNLYFYHAPGHSPCSLMAYSPEEEVLFFSDCAGFPVDDRMIFPVFFQRYDAYVETIKRMLELPVSVLAGAHGDIITGTPAVRSFLESALGWAEWAGSVTSKAVRSGTDPDEVAARIFKLFYHHRLRMYTPENIMMCSRLIVKRAMEAFCGSSDGPAG